MSLHSLPSMHALHPAPSVRFAGATLVHPGGRRALAPLDLTIGQGECVVLIGPSGAGKTSFLRLAGAAWRPSAGQVNVLGSDPWAVPPRGLRRLRARIGVIHQAAPIPPRSRLVTAVLAGRLGQWSTLRALASLIHPSDIPGARAALARVGLAERLFDRCDRLSGGQLQRVGVARSLYQQPDLLLADEPVSSLDPVTGKAVVRELVADARARGTTLITALHAVDLALENFPRVIGLRAGAVMFDLPATQVTRALLDELYEGDTEPVEGMPAAPSAQPLVVSR